MTLYIVHNNISEYLDTYSTIQLSQTNKFFNEYTNVYTCEITKLKSCFADGKFLMQKKFKNLKKLSIWEYIDNITLYLKNFKNLEILLLHNSTINDTSLIESINIKTLLVFTFTKSNLINTYRNINYLKNLENLNMFILSNNCVEGFDKCTNLKKLSIHIVINNMYYPIYLNNLINLEYLKVSGNGITNECISECLHH
jgi:hypothetical protein